jgi:hypothetical protein
MTDLQALLDRNALTTLVHSVGRNLDLKRFDEFRSIYTPDARAETPGGVGDGIDAILAQVRRNHDGFEVSQHLFGDVHVAITGDRAEVGANTLVTLVPRATDLGINRQLGVFYSFDAARTSGGWRFTRVGITPLWSRSTLVA